MEWLTRRGIVGRDEGHAGLVLRWSPFCDQQERSTPKSQDT
jgi:hypothetical protein